MNLGKAIEQALEENLNMVETQMNLYNVNLVQLTKQTLDSYIWWQLNFITSDGSCTFSLSVHDAPTIILDDAARLTMPHDSLLKVNLHGEKEDNDQAFVTIT